ncbi:MAG: flavodoxin family protein [Kiritimatiellia bacterium]
MKIIAINGSPDPTGNTAFLLQQILSAMPTAETETQILQAADIVEQSGAPFCCVCSTPCSGQCYADTPLEAAYQTLTNADAIILGSPVYFGTVSAPLKAFFDKTRKLRATKALLNTIGAAVAVGASRFGGQETTVRALHDMMLVQGMIIVGDGDAQSDCGHQGVSAQRPANTDAFAAERCAIMGRRIFTVAQATRDLRRR